MPPPKPAIPGSKGYEMSPPSKYPSPPSKPDRTDLPGLDFDGYPSGNDDRGPMFRWITILFYLYIVYLFILSVS
jgi:hypothetical protein